MTAYAAMPQQAGAQRALEMIIAEQTPATATATAPSPVSRLPILPLAGATGLRTASLGVGQPGSNAFGDLFSGTFSAAQQNETTAAALARHIARRPIPGAMRTPDMIAPDLEHIADVFTAPAAVSSDHFATIWDHDEADFDPTAEMGKYVTIMRVGDAPVELSHTSFVTAKPVALSAN